MSNREELIKEYILKGGDTFNVKKITSYRDGGTRVIILDNGKTFYIDKDMQNLYYDYPLTTRVEDLGLQSMLLERVERFLSILEWDIRYANEIINFLKEY